jgi:hypothetical protein
LLHSWNSREQPSFAASMHIAHHASMQDDRQPAVHQIALPPLLKPLPPLLHEAKINVASWIRVGAIREQSITRKFEGERATHEGREDYGKKKREFLEDLKYIFFLKTFLELVYMFFWKLLGSSNGFLL